MGIRSGPPHITSLRKATRLERNCIASAESIGITVTHAYTEGPPEILRSPRNFSSNNITSGAEFRLTIPQRLSTPLFPFYISRICGVMTASLFNGRSPCQSGTPCVSYPIALSEELPLPRPMVSNINVKSGTRSVSLYACTDYQLRIYPAHAG